MREGGAYRERCLGLLVLKWYSYRVVGITVGGKAHVDIPAIPVHLIRRARAQRRLSREKLADLMTQLRDSAIPDSEYPPFTMKHVWKIEAGRCVVRFGDENEPIWWLLKVLELSTNALLNGETKR